VAVGRQDTHRGRARCAGESLGARPRRSVLAALDEELPALQRALGGDQQLVHSDRLHQEGVRAELQALDGDLHVRIAAGDDDGRVRVLLANLQKQPDARIAHRLAALTIGIPRSAMTSDGRD